MTRKGILDGLAATWQNLATIGGAVAFGAAVALALSGWMHLPADVEEQGDAIVELRTDLSRVQRSDSAQTADIKRTLCLVEAIVFEENPSRKCGL